MVLAAQLPRESRTLRAEIPALEWGDAEYLLALIADNLSFLRYESAVASGAKRAKKPKPVKRPANRRAVVRGEGTVHGMSKQRVAEILARPRE